MTHGNDVLVRTGMSASVSVDTNVQHSLASLFGFGPATAAE